MIKTIVALLQGGATATASSNGDVNSGLVGTGGSPLAVVPRYLYNKDVFSAKRGRRLDSSCNQRWDAAIYCPLKTEPDRARHSHT